MKPSQYTLSTGKTRISLQAGQTNIHKAAPGETYRVLKRKGEKDQENLADDVVASRHGQDLHLDYADGTTLTLQDWFTQSDTSVTLPADGTSTQLMTPASTEGAALADGSHVFYAHGSPDALASMTSGHPGLESILSGLQNGSVVSGHPVTYLPQSHSYTGYLAGVVGLGGVVGVAVASGGGGGGNGDKHDNGAGEATVQNNVELNFVGGPALSGNDLNVEIYQADGKTLIGTGTLGPNGSVTVSAGSYSGVVIVKLVNSGSAADYLDEATGAGKDLSAQLWSMGVISGDNSTLVLNINVLTTLAYTKAQQAIGGTPDSPATLSATQVADTSAAISSLFGVDDILNTTVVATNGGSYDATDGLSAGEKYGLLLAAFSGAEANAGASTQTILDTITAGTTLGSSSSLSDGVQSLLIKGAAAATDTSGGLSLIIDTHAPVFTSATTASVDENIGAGQVVWTAVATDPSQFSYSLSSTGDSALFSINASTGAVTLTSNPDYESKASYSFTVVATDAAGNASSQTVTLGINNLDDAAPTITSGTTATAIDENSGAGQVIYTATATDSADISAGVTFSLKAGSDAGLTINPTTGAVTLTGNPDFESKASYSFTVVATDAAGNASSQAVTLGINNLDDATPTITSGTTATAIDENSGAGQVIYTATATDTADISGGVTFSLKAGSDAGLTINPTTGAVTLTGNPDFESKAGYSFTVVATDAAGNASSQAVTLGINNLDEVAPTITSGATATAINENSGAGQVIYTATATDSADISAGITYSLKAGSDAGLTINPTTGAVTLTGNPDFESKAGYSFTVVATDAAGNASSQAVTLGINNLDEVAPTITSGATATAINENSGAGQVIYTATATDTGDISGGVTFSLKAGSDAGLTINPTTGAVTLTGNPNFESKASYSFTVVATDAAGNASSQAVTLGINNLDEVAPTITSGATATAINENSGAGQVIYTATATDSGDISHGVTFSLKAGSDAGLTIDPITGAVTLTGNPDFESKASYSFTVVATDAAGNHSDRTVTLGINNLDEVAPTITSGATATAINENSGAGQVVYTATATDTGDISHGVTFSLKAGSDADLAIDPITGAVTLTGNPDFESKTSYSFTVVATDAAGNHSDQTVTLGINNVDEQAPSFTTGNSSDSYASATVSVVENTDASTVLYTAQAFDNDAADGGEHVTYSLADEFGRADAQYFTIDATTGAVTFNTSPDYEDAHAPQYTFNVVATDAAGHTTTQSVTVNVTDVDEIAPTVTLDGSTSGPVMLSPATNYTYPNGFDTTALGDGSFLVTWAGNNNGSYGIYAQRLSAQGVALGEPVQLASGATNTFYNSSDSIVSVTAINDAGAYAVAWIGQDSSIYAQLFNADGSPLSAAAQLDGDASAQGIAPQIATLADGGYIVTWYTSNGGGVYVQRFDDTGVAVGNTVPLAVSDSYPNASPQVTVLDNGGYVVTWQGNTAGDYHIYVQQFDANGTGATPVVLDATTGSSNSYETQPQITALANGGYVVTWSGFDYSSSNNDSSTYVQQFDATGARVGSIVVLDNLSTSNMGGNYTNPYVAALADGGYAITWMEYGNANGFYETSVYVQQFTAGGSKVGATVQLDAPHNNSSFSYDQLPRITALGDGGYVVTWMGYDNSGQDVYVQKFNASGVAVGDIVRLEAAGGAIDQFPQVTAAGADGEYMVTWYAWNPANGMPNFHLYVQKFNADGSTYENFVVLNHDGQATVQSSESGTVYLVNDDVVVSQLSDITGAASDQWASTIVTANTRATISAANLAEGTYHAWAVDAAGNLSVISGSSVMVDNTVPVFTSASTAADITDSTAVGDIVYTAAASDAHGITYSLNDTVHFRINASTGVVTLLSSPAKASGAQFIVTATDAAGNQTTQTVTYNVVDTTPPGVTLISDLDGVEHSGETVTVQSSEAGTVYLVSDSVTVTDLNSLINAADNLVNSVAVTANAGTALALTGLADGTYHAYAVDASGNVSAISGSSVAVDNTAPVISGGATATGSTLTSGAAAGTQVYDANASDAHAITYSLDQDSLGLFDINATTGVVTLNSAAVAGSYNVIVTATDAAGNHSSQTVTIEVTAGNNLDGSAMVSGSTTNIATQMTVNVGLEKLSNGYTVMEYMRQTGGDNLTGDPTGALYDGVVRVLDANNNVVKTIDISVPAGYTMQDTQIKALANGGFVVAWSQVDAINWADFSVHYAIYDNNGNLQSSDTLASPGAGVTIAAQSSANGGDFAIAYQTMGPGTDQQEAVSVFHYNGSGSNFTQGTQTLIGGNSASQNFGGVASPAVQLMKFQLTPGVLTALSDGSYVLASEVYDWIGTPGQSATSTPIGAFIFKLDDTGSLVNFDSGTTWQRVNWNDEQGSPTNVIAFDGGFAVFSQEYRSATWEVTLYNNNGTLITTNVQSNTVYGMGTQSYHAVDVGAMDKETHSGLAWYINGYLAGSATAYDNGTDLVFVFPDGNGGLSQTTISKTTGELTSDVTDSGITVPQGGQLYNPRIVSDGAGGYDITYSVLFDSDTLDGGKSGYAVGDIYQIGLNAPVAPTVTDAHIAITSTPGGADGMTYKVGDTVTAVWDNSASGDANTNAVSSVTMDFSQFGASTPATAWDDGTHGDAIAGDGKYTAQYTLTAGAINNVDSRNVAVTVTTANHGTATAADSTSLTVDNTAPVLTSSTPQDNGGSVVTGANLTLTFSEDVLAGSGHITLVNESNSSLNKVIDITDSSQVSISGNTVTVNPTTDLAAGANYHVQIDSSALHDTAGNDYAGISTSTALNFTTVSAGIGDPSIVVFDLTTGQSSDHNGRVFDANTAYTIYIKVNSTSFSLAGLDSNEMWSGAQNLGTDDKIVLVGTGSDVKGIFGNPVTAMHQGGNSVNWMARSSSTFSYNVAGITANGQFSRNYGNNADLWNGTWAANPNGDNTFAQAYLQAMPAGVLTSQGLAIP